MRRAVFFTLMLLLLVATPATAAPTCYNCQNGQCWSSIMFEYRNCISSSTGACDAWEDCPYWLASADNHAGTANVQVSCKNRSEWELVASDSFSAVQDRAPKLEWRVTGATVQSTVASNR